MLEKNFFQTEIEKEKSAPPKPELKEKEISKEKIESLPDWEEPTAYYRGVKVEDAIKALFGELKLESEPRDEILGSRDNATLNLHEAIYFAPTSKLGKKKFNCAIGFETLPGTKVEKSFLGRSTFVRITGNILAKEIIIRFAGKKPGQPQKKVLYFSPKEFFYWYEKNLK